jgi:hypothetical protein
VTPEEQDELWHALGVLSRLSKDEELSRLVPGLEAVSEVLTEQVGSALNKLKQSGARVVRGKSMTVTRLGPDGKPTGPPISMPGTTTSTLYDSDHRPVEVNFVNNPGLAVGERPGWAEVQAKLRETRKRRGIGR